MPDSEAESETGSMLMLKYAAHPKLHCSRKHRNINNFKHHMQSLSENIESCFFEERDSKSTFQKVLENPEHMEFVHSFFKLSEEEQTKMISSLNTIHEEIEYDDEPSIFIDNSIVDGIHQKNGLGNLSKKYIKFLQRQHPLDVFEDIENQLRLKFHATNHREDHWEGKDFTGYDRYVTHIIAQYLGLVSESFNKDRSRVIRVSNRSRYFKPPKNFLYQEMENSSISPFS